MPVFLMKNTKVLLEDALRSGCKYFRIDNGDVIVMTKRELYNWIGRLYLEKSESPGFDRDRFFHDIVFSFGKTEDLKKVFSTGPDMFLDKLGIVAAASHTAETSRNAEPCDDCGSCAPTNSCDSFRKDPDLYEFVGNLVTAFFA